MKEDRADGAIPFLQHYGLLNHDAPDFGLIGSVNIDPRVTYCSGACGKDCSNPRGRPVHIGNAGLQKCPRCGTDIVMTDRVSLAQSRVIKRAIDEWKPGNG